MVFFLFAGCEALRHVLGSSARNDPIASYISKPSNDAIVSKDFAISNAPSGSNILGVSNVSNASSDAIASNDLSVSNAPTVAVASNNHVASDVPDAPGYPNAYHSRSSSSAHTISSSSDGASKPTDSRGTPDSFFSSDSPNPHTSSNVPDTTIPSKRKYPTEEP
jgi:hypothetical protein